MEKYFVLAIILFLSCSKNLDKKEYYSNGNIKAINAIENDSVQFRQTFYPNGVLSSEGNLWNDSLLIDRWKYYDTLGNKVSVTEHIKLANTSYFNQRWRFNQKGDTIGGNYYTFVLEDTITVNNDSRVYFSLTQPVMSDYSYAYVCLPLDDDELKSDFSNQNKIEWDTIPNIAEFYQKNKKHSDERYGIVFDFKPTSTGQKYLRGFILEKDTVAVDTFDFVTRKIYFDIPYYVKDTID